MLSLFFSLLRISVLKSVFIVPTVSSHGKRGLSFHFFACGGERCTKSILKEVYLWVVLFSKSNVYCCILDKHVSWGSCNPHMTEPVDVEAERETVTGLEAQSCLIMGLVCT